MSIGHQRRMQASGDGATSSVCTACNVAKEPSAFFPSPLHPRGHTPRCRSCIFAAAAAVHLDRERRRLSKGDCSLTVLPPPTGDAS